MAGKSDRATAEREFFDAGLKRYLTENDMMGIKEGWAIAQRWSSRGAFIGLLTGCIVGFPYSRRYSAVLITTLRQIRTKELAVPSGTTPMWYAFARAHREGADAAGAKGLREGTLNSKTFTTTTLKNSLVGAAWALFFSFAGRTAGALLSTWPAEDAVRRVGGDPERIRQAANQVVYELGEARAKSKDGRLQRPASDDEPFFGGNDQVNNMRLDQSAEQAAGDLNSRRDQSAFLTQQHQEASPPKSGPRFSQLGTRLNEATIYFVGGSKNDSKAESSASLSDADPANDAATETETSRWDQLRNNRQAQPSTWERIRQEQGRPSATASTTRRDPISADAAPDDRAARQRDFQTLLEKESQGGDEKSEIQTPRKTTRFV